MPVSKVYFSIPPLNDQSVSSAANVFSGGFSNVKGNANIKFALSAQDRLLDTSDLYLTGRILHCTSTGAPITLKAGAATTIAEFNANNGNTLQAYTNQNISNWGGVQNMVKRVFIQSKKTSVSISEHRNYPMFVNTKTAWTNARDDFLVSPLTRYDAAGTEADFVNRHSSLMDNQNTAAGAGQMPNVPTQNSNEYGKPFSFKLDTALLNNAKPLHLGNGELGGLLINLELNQEGQFYYNRFFEQSQTGADLNVDGSFYIVKDLRLTGRLLVPTPQDLADYNPNMLLSDRFNLINDVNSSTNSAKYTPNAAAVRSFVNLYLDSDQENSRLHNGSNFRIPLGLESYTQQKNNVRQPYDYVVEVEPNQLDKTNNAGVAISAQNVVPKVGMVGDSEVREQFQRAVLNGETTSKCSVGLETQEASILAQYDMTRGATPVADGCGLNCSANAMGIGCDYTFAGLQETSDYRQRDYDQIVVSGVNSGDAVLPGQRSSKAELIQTYVRSVAAFNTQTLVKTV